MAKTTVTWHGTADECQALVSAIAANCDCATTGQVRTGPPCAAHRMLATDQHALDTMLYFRRTGCAQRREHTVD